MSSPQQRATNLEPDALPASVVRTLPPGRGGSLDRILTSLAAALFLLAPAPVQSQQAEDLRSLAVRLSSIAAVTGYEQALVDTLIRILPGAVKDRAGNAVLSRSGGTPRRLAVCPLDEPGYVVGGLHPDGYLTLRRAPGTRSRLLDQQLEGQRITIKGRRGAVPGVVAVRSIHLTRGRSPVSEQPFTVDDAWVDVGASGLSDLTRLGIHVLAPVTLAKRPHLYGRGLLAAPVAGRRSACAALLLAALQTVRQGKGKAPPTIAFVVEQELSRRGLNTVANLNGPFDETLMVDGRSGQLGSVIRKTAADTSGLAPRLGRTQEWSLQVRYAGTPVETVSLADVDSLRAGLVQWLGQ